MHSDVNIKPLKIGNVAVDFPVMLAPMAGYTDVVMRPMAVHLPEKTLAKRTGNGIN